VDVLEDLLWVKLKKKKMKKRRKKLKK